VFNVTDVLNCLLNSLIDKMLSFVFGAKYTFFRTIIVSCFLFLIKIGTSPTPIARALVYWSDTLNFMLFGGSSSTYEVNDNKLFVRCAFAAESARKIESVWKSDLLIDSFLLSHIGMGL